MRPRTAERLWCDEHGITMDQARRLGGYLRLIELAKNHPDTYNLVMSDIKHCKKAATAA